MTELGTTSPQMLELTQIRIDPVCQSRVTMSAETINDYAEVMSDEADDGFPPVMVFHDGTDYWLSDGFHRHAAAKKAGLRALKTDIRQGSQRDAILYAVGANARHGLRRTNKDKRKAVSILLQDSEWMRWGSREIARRCGVDESLVRKLRPVSAVKPQMARQVERNGTIYQMNTTGIGKKDGSEEPGDTAPGGTVLVSEAVAEATKDKDRERQLDALIIAWGQASEDVRAQFLDMVFPPTTHPQPNAEAGTSLTTDPPSEPDQSLECHADPSPDPVVSTLMTIWSGLKGHTQSYGRRWVEDGCPSTPRSSEHFVITDKLAPFRAAAQQTTLAQRQAFLELSRDFRPVAA